MPNAKDASPNEIGKPKIILIGGTGAGKTSQVLTLPGRTFCYLFDPSALSTLRGHDIEYEMFYPTSISTAAKSLSKGKGDSFKGKEDASEVYRMWEDDFERKKADKYWDKIDNVVFDSFTTFSDVVMDRILFLNGRAGQFPQQDDWTAQMQAITNVVRTLVGMNKLLICTAHDEFKQDEATKRMQNMILLTGKLRVKLPLLFSEIYHCESQCTPEAKKFIAQTRPDRMNPNIRCTIQDVPMFLDVTIGDWKKPKEYGLGKLLREKLGYNPSPVVGLPSAQMAQPK